MSASHLIGYFLLITFGGLYASAIFWSGWYFFSRLINHREAVRRQQVANDFNRAYYGARK